MKNLSILLALSCLLMACEENITVTMSKQSGELTGKVMPENVVAEISLFQGGLIDETLTNNGLFRFSSLNEVSLPA